MRWGRVAAAVVVVAAAGAWFTNGHDETSAPATGGYSRALFGDGFVDTDGDGCTQRDNALGRDLRAPIMDGCSPVSGTLVSPYTGAVVAYERGARSKVDADHVYPLHLAWSNGAAGWSQERRVQFANDTENLLMVDSSSNRSKGDAGPSGWLPPNVAFRCEYVQDFEKVAVKYELTVPVADQRVIDEECK